MIVLLPEKMVRNDSQGGGMSTRKAGPSLLLILALLTAHGATQTADDYATKRAQALKLFNQDKHLEALPLFEDLASRNPKDAQVLLGLATCLVSKAATIENEAASAKVRVRARELLLQAKELGLTSALMENLLQTIPPDGVVHYSDKPADRAMRAAEAAFARRDFDEAIRQYSRVLEFDPKNYSAVLYIGDSYFAARDFPKAAEGYERATQVDPNRETAWRYWCDMVTKQGDLGKARDLAIQAVIAEPYNSISSRGLQQWANAAHVQLPSVKIHPKSSVSVKDGKISINLDPSQSDSRSGAVWLAYAASRSLWRGERFKKEFPNETEYRHSLTEESDALASAAKVWLELAESDVKNGKPAQEPDSDIGTLLKLSRAGMIEPYVLLNAADDGIAKDYPAYRASNRAKLAQYLADFVVPAVPGR